LIKIGDEVIVTNVSEAMVDSKTKVGMIGNVIELCYISAFPRVHVVLQERKSKSAYVCIPVSAVRLVEYPESEEG